MKEYLVLNKYFSINKAQRKNCALLFHFSKVGLIFIFMLICKSAISSKLHIIFHDSISTIQVLKFKSYLQNERESFLINKTNNNGFDIEINEADTTGIIIQYKNKLSHTFYLTPGSIDTVYAIAESRRVKLIPAVANFNYPIQLLEDYLFDNNVQNKKDIESKVAFAKHFADSIQQNYSSRFVNTSIQFQLYGYQFSQYNKHKIKDKHLMKFSSKLNQYQLDERIGSMMAFFIIADRKLWFCAQHTQLNTTFLFIKNKNQLNDVIFNQRIYSVPDYENLSRWLRIKLIQNRGYYYGDKKDLTTLCDSLINLQTNPYLKQLFKSLIKNKDGSSPIEYGSLRNYPFFDRKKQATDIDSFLGKPVLIDFWATWCKPCIAGFSKLNQLNRKYKDQLTIISMNVDDDINKMTNFLEKRPDLNWIFLYNGLNESVMSRFGVVSYPHYALLDKDGNILYKNLPPPSTKEFEEIINTLLKEK